jgi:signal transduction histidine kinase
MRIYQILSRFPLLKKYSYKFLFIAFLGIHVPLIGTIIYMVFGDDTTLTHENIILMVLSFTLIATAATLFVLNQLLEPLIIAKNALEAYIQSRALPSLQTALMSMDEFVQAKKDMVTLLSHDLRSPIARTLGLAELLKSDLPWSEAQEYIELIRQENKNQLALLDYILEQLRQEQLEITEDKKEYINLKELVQRSINTLSSIISQKNLEITVDLPEKFKVRVEKILFGQVILNLLHNACKFSFPNGKIHFETKSHNNLTHIQIKDQGIGFYQSGIEKYFQRFTDFGQQGTAGEKSTGIGLYLSRRIIERHSGSLKGKSDGPNKGATFEIVIPE